MRELKKDEIKEIVGGNARAESEDGKTCTEHGTAGLGGSSGLGS